METCLQSRLGRWIEEERRFTVRQGWHRAKGSERGGGAEGCAREWDALRLSALGIDYG